MRLLINSFRFIILFLCCIRCNQQTVSESKNNRQVKTDSILPISPQTFTILTSGFPPPLLYENARVFVEKKYNVKFVYAAGCIVNERLDDSISEFNEATLYKMNKLFKRDMAEDVYKETESEYNYLNKLDSLIRGSEKFKQFGFFKEAYIYYIKKKKNYLAYFIVSGSGKPVFRYNPGSTYRLKLVSKIDSASMNINNIEIKDSLINTDFSDLQHD